MSEKHNFISVIVPCLNSERTIEKCIASLLGQDYPLGFFEIILVDNGSKDKTVELISNYQVELLMENERNPYIARNKGVSHSKGQVLAFTDSNCEADSNWLASINEYINKGVEVSQGPGFLTKQKEIVPRAECNQWIMTEDDFWGDGKNIAMLKSVFIEAEGFPPHYTGGDSLMVYKLRSMGYNVKFNPGQKVYREFSTSFFVLLKKNWKYGKGDVAIDVFNNRLNRKKRIKQLLKYPFLVLMRALTSKNIEDLLIYNFYYYTMKSIRSVSYLVNYKQIKLTCQNLNIKPK